MSAGASRLDPKHRRASLAFVEAIDSPDSGAQICLAQLDSISSNEMFDLSASLDPVEQARAARFHFERHRQRFIAARGILRSLLAAALDISPAELMFEYGPHGKPRIKQSCQLRFNISHASGLAIFALSWDREIGIDIEAASRLKNKDETTLSELAARILSPRELTIWRALPDDEARTFGFLRAWTRKEAYLKATGEGLFAGLQRIEVALDAAAPESALVMRDSTESQTERKWVLHDLDAPIGFIAALAIEKSSTPRGEN
jgi:4'-phosphopantetheinyl transferase